MLHRNAIFLTGAALCLALPGIGSSAAPIPTDQFTRLHALIKPGKDEDKWARIPWSTDLWEARKQAAAQGKPLLLWEMDGHPLGCT